MTFIRSSAMKDKHTDQPKHGSGTKTQEKVGQQQPKDQGKGGQHEQGKTSQQEQGKGSHSGR